jgi:CBS domain-containing protein
MFVEEILARKPGELKTVAPGETLEHCAAHMVLSHVGALLVCEGRRLLGVIAERDIVRALVDAGPRALGRRAEAVMDAHPVTCAPGDTIAAVAKRMTHARVRHVPVCERGQVIGVVSIGDLVKDRFEEMELERDTLRDMAAAHRIAV